MPQTHFPKPHIASAIAKLQEAMKEFGLQAVVLEPGPAMLYLTGVRWGKSERTFAVVLPLKGEPVWVLPGFEETRARELIHVGDRHPCLAGRREPVRTDRAGVEGSRRHRHASESTKRPVSSSSTASANWRRSWSMCRLLRY